MGITASGIGFIGRKKELKHLRKCLKEGQNVALLAPRRFGKSSLIAQALKQFKKEGHLTAYVDLFSAPTAELLSPVVTKEVLKNLKLHKAFMHFCNGESDTDVQTDLLGILEDYPFITGFSKPATDKWAMVSESLDFPETFACRQEKQMICAYENVGNIQQMDQGGKLSEMLRSKLGQHTHSSYIFSACHYSDLPPTLLNGKSPIIKREHIIRLNSPNSQELIDSLNKEFSRLKLKLSPHYVNDLVNLTQGHPTYTQLAIHKIILSYVLEGQIPRQKELPDLLLRHEIHYLEKIWEDISRNREYVQILLALPSGSTNIYPRLKTKNINVARAQKKLEEMGLLLKNEQAGYSIADPLFELWIRKKF